MPQPPGKEVRVPHNQNHIFVLSPYRTVCRPVPTDGQAFFMFQTVLLIGLLATATLVRAQTPPDTIYVYPGVTIVDSSRTQLRAGAPSFFSIPSAGRLSSLSLGAILEELSLVHISRNGESGSAMASIRGVGASGTVITLDGHRLMDPLTGTFDLSLLPGAMLKDVTIIHGSSQVGGARGMGGTIRLSTDERRGSQVAVSLGAWGRRSLALAARVGRGRHRFSFIGQIDQYDGDFDFPDPVLISRGSRVRRDADRSSNSLLLTSTSRWRKNTFSTSLLRTRVERGIPALSNAPSPGGRQWDGFTRLYTSFRRPLKNGIVDVALSGSTSTLRYEHPLRDPSRMDVRNVLATAQFSHVFQKHWLFDGFGEFSFSSVMRPRHLNRSDWLSALEVSRTGRVATVRFALEFTGSESQLKGQSSRSRIHLSPVLSGILRPFARSSLALHAAFSGVYRSPTLNDLYWIPGGNAYLKPESGKSAELALSWRSRYSRVTWNPRITAFLSQIDDRIVWRPRFAGAALQVWTPENIGLVRGHGVEFENLLEVNRHWKLRLAASLTSQEDRTNPLTASHRRQLRYTPQTILRSQLLRETNSWRAILSLLHTGRQFTASDESRSIPGWTKSTISVERTFILGPQWFTGWIAVDNIFDVSYETSRFQPMPGRHLRLGFTLVPRARSRPEYQHTGRSSPLKSVISPSPDHSNQQARR